MQTENQKLTDSLEQKYPSLEDKLLRLQEIQKMIEEKRSQIHAEKRLGLEEMFSLVQEAQELSRIIEAKLKEIELQVVQLTNNNQL